MIVQRSAIAFFVTALGLAACSGEPDEGSPDGAGGGDGDLGTGGTGGPTGGAGNSGGGPSTGGAIGNSGGGPGAGGVIGNSGGGPGAGGGDPGTGGDGPGTGGDGPGAGGGDGTGGDDGGGTGGAPGTVGDGPCDIYEDAGTPCAAAYSPIRRLKADYTGPLYQVRVGSSEYNNGGTRVTNPITGPETNQPYQTQPEPGTLLDIPQAADGFVNATALEDACSTSAVDGNPLCTVSKIYDQSGNGTDITVALAGLPAGGTWSDYDNFETVMNGNARLTAGGRNVYSIRMEARNGYRIEEIGENMPVGEEPQGVYLLADGTHYGVACCWDFGNVSPDPKEYREMNTLLFGEAWWGNGSGQPPWFGADFEAGVWMGGSQPSDPGWGGLNNANPTGNPNSPSFQGVPFALGFLKTDDDNDITYAIRMANIDTATTVHEAYRGPHPKGHTDNPGAVTLGVGGDNSNNAWGNFFEGAIVIGFPTDAAEQAVMENIQAVGYSD